MTLFSRVSGIARPAPIGSRGWQGALAGAGLALAAVSFGPQSLQAQRLSPTLVTIDSMRADGSVVAVPLRKEAGGFKLFAGEDFNCAYYRATGEIGGGTANQGGPVPFNQSSGCVNAGRYGAGTGNGWYFFEMGLVGAAPPSEWRKIRAVYPNARTMTGSPGYAAFWHFTVSTPNRIVIGPADGQFGKNFSGVTIAFDGTCRNDILAQREGFSLMGMLDCPVTWGSEGYKGKLVVSDSAWKARFTANPNTFSWDDFKFDRSTLNQTQYLGQQNFYSYMSDYFREVKLRYGSVVPGGTGAPTEQGYPLGLEMKLDGWTFGSPAVRNSQWYNLTVVNKSADVYGTGISYDSLYYGLGPGVIPNGQASSFYFDMGRNTIFMAGGNLGGACSGTLPKRYIGQTAGCNASGTGGIYAITWLKSPLGDVRNKLFSDPKSVYYNPTHPNAGDTINFNHAKWGAFGQSNMQISTRAAFGMFASKEDDYLDGRPPSGLQANFLNHFQPEFYDGVVPDAANAKFNRFVPSTTINAKNNLPYGKWDYNHDGVPDTIFVPGCGTRGCHENFSDTLPGGYRNSFGNILNSITAGPFKLKAGDTTQFLFGFTWAADTLNIKLRVDGLIDSYLTNYAGPTAIAFPVIAEGFTYSVSSAEFVDSTRFGIADATVGAQVTLRFPQINAVDGFFLKAINKIRQDSINNVGVVRRVLSLNPGLLATLTARANDNLSGVYLFKSCDGGNTFTNTSGNSGTCTSAPTRNTDDALQAFSWRPITRIVYTGGIPATGQFQEFVQGGRSYLYTYVTRTRGFSDIRVVDSIGGKLGVTNASVLGLVVDTINSPLATSGPGAVNVYAPLTEVAGRKFAHVDTSTVAGKANQDIQLTNIQNIASGTTKVVYANQFIVRKVIDTLTSATTTTINARYIIPAASTTPAGPAVTNFVAREQTFTVGLNIPVRAGAALLAGTQRSLAGSARVFVDTINAVTGSMGYVWVTSDNRPIYVVDNQYATNFDQNQLNSPLYPSYTMRSRDSSNSATGIAQEAIPSGTVRDRDYLLRAPGDTVQPNAKQFTVLGQPILTTIKKVRGGKYKLTWLTDPWGPGAPFKLDPTDKLQDAVSASLNTVAGLATTLTDITATTATMVGATAARPLVRVHLPFTMTYTDAETGVVENVKFAMLSRQVNGSKRLLGSANDTLRVQIPDTLWLPGDTLYVLQKVSRDSSIGTGAARFVVVNPETLDGVAGYRPIQISVDSIGLFKWRLSCTPGAVSGGTRADAFDAFSCNPLVINSRGATPAGGYLPVAAGWSQEFTLTRTFDARSTVKLTATPFTTGGVLTKANLDDIVVVPNPYVVRSDMDDLSGRTPTSKVFFTGVPDQGTLRVYSVSGQFLQELKWTRTDLVNTGLSTPTGDLGYNLRTREGTELGSGLYIYVLTATGSNGKNQVHRGKFVVIR